jgi:hypothetical protein
VLTTADYLSAIVLTVIGIAVFINLKNGTLPEWAKAKFLGEGSTSSSSGSSSTSSSSEGLFGTSWNPLGLGTDVHDLARMLGEL